jgi:hypothetical protein
VKITFYEKISDTTLESTDWMFPPRIGDQVFLIGLGSVSGLLQGVQIDAVVIAVTFFGPHHALVNCKKVSK